MTFKVFIQQIAPQPNKEGEQNAEANNLNIRVKCSTTQEEFKGQAFLQTQFIDKLQKWVNKGKFSCVAMNNNTEMELRVQIFKFQLKKLEKSDIESLKQEVCQMRKDNEKLKGELKLFRYYFLHLWKDKFKKDIQQPENNEFRHSLIQNTGKLYDTVEANGLILEDFGAKTYYLTFNSEEQLQQFQASGAGKSAAPEHLIGTPSGPMMGGTPGMGMGMTPGMTPGSNLITSSPSMGGERRNEKPASEGMENLMTRINEYSTMV